MPADPSRTAEPVLRILLAGLPEGDVRRLEVFLGLRSDRLRHAWRIVAEGPVDLYVHDADEAPTIPGRIDRQPLRARVADARAALQDDTALLQRPLQYDAFVDLLLSAEDRLRPPALPTAAAPAAPTARRAAPAAAPEPRLSPAQLGTHRFRLRRWPGADTLQSMRHGMRMASFISARFLSAAELARLSGVEASECSRFLSTLIDADLLRGEPLQTEPGAAATSTPAERPARAVRPDRSLLSSLRDKLGIRTAGR